MLLANLHKGVIANYDDLLCGLGHFGHSIVFVVVSDLGTK